MISWSSHLVLTAVVSVGGATELDLAAGASAWAPVTGEGEGVLVARKQRLRPKKRPLLVQPEEEIVDSDPVSPALSPELKRLSSNKLLETARQMFNSLDYDQVIPMVEEVLEREEQDVESRLDAYLLLGASLAIVGRTVDAEKPFRFLLRGRPSYDMPPATPPKILAVFRKVQVEERAIIDQMKELERQRILAELGLLPDLPDEARGGQPLAVAYKLRDPHAAVVSVRLNYRRKGAPEFSSLPMQVDEGGRWVGVLTAAWTSDEEGFELEYYVVTTGNDGAPLLADGSIEQPLSLLVAPGTLADSRPFYRTVWFWVTSSGALVAAATATGVAIYALTRPPSSDLEPPLEIP